MSGHTPGPWRIIVDGTCSGAWPHIVGPDFQDAECCAGDAIAELGTCFVERRTAGTPGSYAEKPERFRKTRDHDQVMADARLICASPYLLEALKYARRFLKPSDVDMAFIDSALARATGEAQ